MSGEAVVNGAIVLSVAAALWAFPRAATRGGDTGKGHGLAPEALLAVVTGLVYLNQVLFTMYVFRVHGGDPAFIARYLPDGWFELADGNGSLRWLAAHFPAPELLAPSVLRVQAFLELPFVLLAFLSVLRWLDPSLYRRVARTPALLWSASAAYTIVFCVVEWDLRNPYTVDDIAIRLVAGLVTPPLLAALAGRDRRGQAPPPSAAGLAVFLVSTTALGYLVLVVYDTALLYNLGRMEEAWPGALGALAVLAAARAAAGAERMRSAASPGGAVAAAGHGLRWFLGLFFVPALAVRYGVTFGTPILAAAAGLLLLLVAAVYALRETRSEAERHGEPTRAAVLSVQLGLAVAAGTAAAGAAVRAVTAAYYEVALLAAGAAFLVTAPAVCAASDAISRGCRPRPSAG